MTGTTKSADVLVIGAGMSGVTAARSLQDLGITSIVLEGRPDRIGGRIWSSSKWPDTPVDLGASWITHMTINPLVDVARENGIDLVPSDILLSSTLFRGDGTQLSDDEFEKALLHYLKAYALVKLAAAQRARSGKRDIGLEKVFPRAIDKLKLPRAKRREVEFFLNIIVTEQNGANLKDLSLYKWDDDYGSSMLAMSVAPAGYVRIAEALAKGLDIRKGHVVTSIEHGEQGVTVSTKDQGEFRAPYAIVTLPHAILAKGTVKFEPRLPGWKRDAIKNIRTGVSDKFYFLFPHKFWKSDRELLGRIDDSGEGRWSTWVNFDTYIKKPILLCFNRTEHALKLEKMSDKQVLREVMPILRKQYGRRTPDPVDMQRSAWHADPFAGGAVPYVPPGGGAEDFTAMGKPVGRLRFAGDHTTPDLPNDVFGAFLSGIREAEKLAWLALGRKARRVVAAALDV
jgi:monoamine oxidase